jgi:probable HAF family extracellular repeat protein
MKDRAMKRWTTTRTIVASILAACLLWCVTTEAKKPDKPGGGGETQMYTLVDLEGFPVAYPGDRTFFQSYAFSLNDPDSNGRVQVVGKSWSQVWPEGHVSPTLWEVNADGSFTITDLGLRPLETNAWATDVNDLGEITISTHGSIEYTDETNTNTILPAWVLLAPGQERLRLPILGTSGEALAINNLGDIAGSDHNRSPAGVFWQLAAPSVEVELGRFDPSDIDESGVMAGFEGSIRSAGSGVPAIAWFDGANNLQIQQLEFLSPGGNATAISQDGTWVAGWLNVGGKEEAFVWTDVTGIVRLGNLGGESSMALGVNNAGQVVGWSDTGDSRNPRTAFFWHWQDGQMLDLDSLADTGGKIQLMEAAEINNAGHIVGFMKVNVKGHNEEQAFVLIPNDASL